MQEHEPQSVNDESGQGGFAMPEIQVDPFIIDIALGSQKYRLRLEPGMDPEQLAGDFAAEHNLDQRLQQKLVE